MYPAYMKESIKKVENTRERRSRETFPHLTDEERVTLLRKYHPDFVREAMRELQVGPSKGELVPNELADLLEGNSRINPRKVDLGNIEYDVDVLVVGGGGAGASVALLAQENGAKTLLVSKLRLGDSNTVQAQAGTQAADRPNDSPAIHYLDTIGGGHFTNVPELVEVLVKDGPSAIKWLESLGVNWDKEPDGSLCELPAGGMSRGRLHSARDSTGLEEMRVLRDEIRNRQIDCIEFSPCVELILDDKGQMAGAILLNLETDKLVLVRAKAVVLATGGIGRLHIQGYPTTNHYGATADGLVLAYRVGAEMIFLDSMQYHPTGAAYPVQLLGQLVSEKVRTLGAQLVNSDGEQFVLSLGRRDLVTSAIIRECREHRKGIETPTGEVGVWLDTPMINFNGITLQVPARRFGNFGIDITEEPVLVYPTLHYQNGGIRIDTEGATSVPGLFSVGECSGGVHGRNRLDGNSTLELFVFGRRTGRAAARYARGVKPGILTLDHIDQWQRRLGHLSGIRPVSPLLLPRYRGKDKGGGKWF